MTNINIITGSFHLNIQYPDMTFLLAPTRYATWYVEDVSEHHHKPDTLLVWVCDAELVSSQTDTVEDWKFKEIKKVELFAFIQCNALNIEVFEIERDGEMVQENKTIPLPEFMLDYAAVRKATMLYLNRKGNHG